MKGCFTHNNVCSQEECIDTAAEPKGNLNFCCCEKSLCNKEFKWSPSAVTTPERKINFLCVFKKKIVF